MGEIFSLSEGTWVPSFLSVLLNVCSSFMHKMLRFLDPRVELSNFIGPFAPHLAMIKEKGGVVSTCIWVPYDDGSLK